LLHAAIIVKINAVTTNLPSIKFQLPVKQMTNSVPPHPRQETMPKQCIIKKIIVYFVASLPQLKNDG
jgi:hypothetical protein